MRKLNTVILLVLLTIAICNSIAIKKLNDEKKKLAKEMDIAVSSKMRNVGYAGPLD